MNLTTKIKYISIYLFLNFIGFYYAFQNWWLIESASPVPTFFILFCFGLCWIGIVFLGIMISQLLFLKTNSNNFISPFSLATREDYLEKFGVEAKKMKRSIWTINFGLLIFSIVIFIYTMNYIKKYQLSNFGKIENAIVKRITSDVKGNEYSNLEYNNGKSRSVILTKNYTELKSISKGDSIKIIYSSKNPEIIELYSSYSKKK